MLNLNVYKIEPRDSKYPKFLVLAQNEDEARSSATAAITTPSLTSGLGHENSSIMNQFYLDEKNATCSKLEAGKDYALISNDVSEEQITISLNGWECTLGRNIAKPYEPEKTS